ncbi:UDP-2,3-diacylglucosamine diphosphatase [Albibacterium indicum]|uniref:UDP-2,3-diacylglucosamine diphosphatase n=1 Tax=Albibacterium indicum TaxID=2292082 RepID=UPI000E4A7C0C|nr:UDP-2,3-diacylglucosamine diphosphatase [Pedobacter indicus]
MTKGKKLYFASDFHLGVPNYDSSLEREKRVIDWLEMVRQDASEIFLMGDVFDFWFEYKHVVPKGFVRFLGKLAELTDEGIKVTLFKGNHDMWMFDYLEKEIGVTIVSDELIIERSGKRFYLHHGDGLGPGDKKYKLLKKVFRSKTCQWLFSWIHPSIGIAIAKYWSKNSRLANNQKEVFISEEKEWLVQFSKNMLKTEHFDYFIFGHRHLPLAIQLEDGSQYLNLGEWINYNSFAVFDGITLSLEYWKATARES